jgi:2-polyprenyl-3-methyl-5-hydroxy-6-metoxy-1,4-benzoquinol methylase
MKATTVQRLLDLNRQFYQQFAHPFAETRQRLQPGVKRILERIPMDARILDIGCGSGELAHELARRGFRGVYVGIDFSQALLDVARRRLAEANTSTTSQRIPSPKNNPSDRPHTPSLLTTTDKDPTSPSPSGEQDQGDEAYSPPEASFHFLLTDLSSPSWPAALPLSQFDIVLAFSVLHHLPGRDLRLAVLRQIHDLLAPEGVFIHSEWQFQNSPRLAARIQPWELINLSAEEVDPDDALLDWRRTSKPRPAKDAPGLRYVHQFSEEELAALAAEAGFRILETFYSDGAEGNLGLYQLWKRIQPPR